MPLRGGCLVRRSARSSVFLSLPATHRFIPCRLLPPAPPGPGGPGHYTPYVIVITLETSKPGCHEVPPILSMDGQTWFSG